MLKILLGKDWTANRDEILRRLSEDIRARLPGRILMVPELISHETERRLCAAGGDTASRYAEVLTFTRLARRVSENMELALEECLDGGGRVVAMASAARQLSSRLKAYASVETRPEFLTGLVEGVDEFKRCCISSADLVQASRETEGSLAQKLEELALVMEAYDSLCARGKRDPRDQMTWLLEQMETGSFAREHIFYIDGFPDFTRQHLAVLEHLIRESPMVTVSMNCDRLDSQSLAFEKAGYTASQLLRIARQAGVQTQIEYLPSRGGPLEPIRERLFQGMLTPGIGLGALKTIQAEDIWQECMAAAHQIQELVRSGCRYRDITLVCTDMAAYKSTAELIFHRMHIPLYQAGTEDVLSKTVVITVLAALEAALEDFDQKSMLRYLRSGLSPLTLDESDLVENYSILWGIRGVKWTAKWENHPDGLDGIWNAQAEEKLAQLNGCRTRAVEPLNRLRLAFRKATRLSQQVEALYGFLEEIGLSRRLDQMARQLDDAGENRESQILSQLWEILMGALEQMYDVLGDTHWEDAHFLRLLRLLLSQYDVGTIPPVLDAVQMGVVSAMRCHQQKHLILLGAKEGSLPGYPGSTGLLTDQERVALRNLGVPLTGGAMEGIQAEFAEIYGVFCGAVESITVYCPGDQPSFLFRRLVQMSGAAEEPSGTLGYATADAWEAGAWLARFDAAGEAVALGLQESYLDTARKRDYTMGRLQWEQVRKLYGESLTLSASQVERHGDCRMSYFLKYGIAARERKEAAVDPAEFGTYVHSVLEDTVREIRDKGGFHQVSLEETMEIAHRCSEDYAARRFSQISSERMTYLFRRNTQELDVLVKELWEELRLALFEPRDVEVNFGDAQGLPYIDIPNSAIQAKMHGFVDRVDTWIRGDTTYYRVVDYKTGKAKEFDYCDVFNGLGLQMLLYMFALRNGGQDLLGQRPVAAGVQYFPARAQYISTDGRMEPEEAEEERKKSWKRRGILLEDAEVLQAMEPGDRPSRLDYKINRAGELEGKLADREQMRLLETYVFRVLGRMVEDIAAGNIQPNPYTRGSSHDACMFCPYGAVCRKDHVQGRRNYETMKADRFWEEVAREVHDGR